MTIKIVRMIGVMAAVGFVAACETTPTEADYGNSLASLVKSSAFNPATLESPSDAAVTSVDPDYANAVVVEMRKDVTKPEEVKKPIEMALISSGGAGW